MIHMTYYVQGKSMPNQGAISRVIVNLALFSDKCVQNIHHPLGLIDKIIAIGSIKMLSRLLYLIYNQRFSPYLQAALVLNKYQ